MRFRKPAAWCGATRATVCLIRADEELMIARSVLRSGVAIITD
jgi:acetate kinase